MTTEKPDTPDKTDAPEDDATRKVNDLSFIAKRLISALETENMFLREHNQAAVAARLEEKTKLSHAYERHIKGFTENPDILTAADEEARRRLRVQGEKLHALMEENSMLLKATILAGKQLMDNIAEAVRSVNGKSPAYSGDGSYGRSANRQAPRNLSISLDQSL